MKQIHLEPNGNVAREIALSEEIYTAISLLKLGLGSLQTIGGDNDFYHLPLQLLSNGYERLLKVMFAIHIKQTTGAFPTRKEFKNHGHELTGLLDAVVEDSVFGERWLTAPAGATDNKFLKSDSLHHELLSVLSHFGQFGRYSTLDVIAGKEVKCSPESQWKRIELKIASQKDLQSLKTPEGYKRTRRKINRVVICNLEVAFRALCRWFTLGGGSVLGKRHSGLLSQFLNLRDSTIGKTQWIKV